MDKLTGKVSRGGPRVTREKLGTFLSDLGYDQCQELGDIPAVLLQGWIYYGLDIFYYSLSGVLPDSDKRPSKKKLLSKLFDFFTVIINSPTPYAEPFAPNRRVNLTARLRVREKITNRKPGFFFYRAKEDNKLVFVMWTYDEDSYSYKNDPHVDIEIELLLICSRYAYFGWAMRELRKLCSEYADYGWTTKKLSKETQIKLLRTFFETPQLLIREIIQTRMDAKRCAKRSEVEKKVWKALQSKGMIDKQKITAPLSEIVRVIDRTIQRPPKRREKQKKKPCLMCGKIISGRGRYCSTCYFRRYIALELAGELYRKGIVTKYKGGELTPGEKKELVEVIRPIGSRYTFRYLEKCLDSFVDVSKKEGFPDHKLIDRLTNYGF